MLSYSDLLLTTFAPLGNPDSWPQYARELDAAASGDASALETAARQSRTPAALTKTTTITQAISCLDGPAREPVSAWPRVIGHITHVGKLAGPFIGWGQWAPCAANWPGHATERYTGPWNAKTKTPILLINNTSTRPPATPAPSTLNACWAMQCCSPSPATATRLGYPAGAPTHGESATSCIWSPRRRGRSAEPSARSRNTCQVISHFRHPGMARCSRRRRILGSGRRVRGREAIACDAEGAVLTRRPGPGHWNAAEDGCSCCTKAPDESALLAQVGHAAGTARTRRAGVAKARARRGERRTRRAQRRRLDEKRKALGKLGDALS